MKQDKISEKQDERIISIVLNTVLHIERNPDYKPMSIRIVGRWVIMDFKHEISANVLKWMTEEGFQLNSIKISDNEPTEIEVAFGMSDFFAAFGGVRA